ncbi:MAG: serine--tRNA ligase [Candidatus Roizmanbacteria bacterium]
MLSIDYIRENVEKVKLASKNKNREVDIDKILTLDIQRREIIQQVQKLREERNVLAKSTFTSEVKERGIAIKNELKIIEEKLNAIEATIQTEISKVPNIPLDEVPIGKDSNDNKIIKTWKEPTQFKFTPKSHIDLGIALDLIDFERASKVSGSRGYFLKNQLASLHVGLMFYVLQQLSKKGYTPIIAPSIVKGFTLFGTGQFPWGEPEVYKTNDDDSYLAGTAEVPVTSYYSDEILNEADLPKKFVAFSPCFRKEAGAYGKDTKGLYRVHEFWKIEQVIIGKNDITQARDLHEELQKNAEGILESLDLPYRVLLMCTGDMGEPQMKKYDTETWMPSRNDYGETMSNSIMGDFQTRRLNIKYRNSEGKTEYCYSYNNTALASPRILIAILENYQQEDGSIKIPKVLQGLCGFDKISFKKLA